MLAEAAFLATQDPEDLTAYRDYLLGIWIAMYRQPPIAPDAITNLLNLRFHQDFRTTDTILRSSNDLINQILTRILTAGLGEYGFAVPGTSIEPQGTRTSLAYQAYLAAKTGVSPAETGVRYRLAFPRPVEAVSSPVIETILTLLGFFRDSFQCPPEPAPLIPPPGPIAALEPYAGIVHVTAPFFLEFSEWLDRNGPFYAENYYQIQPTFPFEEPSGWAPILGETIPDYPAVPLGDLNKDLADAREFAQAGEYALAAASLAKVENQLDTIFANGNFKAAAPITLAYNPVWQFSPEALELFNTRRDYRVTSLDSLGTFEAYFEVPVLEHFPWQRIQAGLIHLAACVMPVMLGDIALNRGDYANAVRQYLRTLEPDDVLGLASAGDTPWASLDFLLQKSGDLAYTYDTYGGHRRPGDQDLGIYPFAPDLFIRQGLFHPLEKKFFRLRLGNALLEWADALFRKGDPASAARARELYKAALWLHGEAPPIVPDWTSLATDIPAGIGFVGPWAAPVFSSHAQNPARVSQKSRARLAFFELEAGLNYYGASDDLVPTLRYRTLKNAADRLAAHAKSAETDLLTFIEKIEQLEQDRIQEVNVIRKARLQSDLADQEIAIAEAGVAQAKSQRDGVLAAIDAKEKEIADHDSFWGQLGDYASGLVDILGKGKSAGIGPATEGEGSEKTLTGMDLGVTTLEGGAAVMGGFAAFWVASYLTMSSMADAANQRTSDLHTLMEKTLPAAEAQITLKQRGVTIAQIQKELAQADASLASALLQFQNQRFLSPEFWIAAAAVLRRILRRYLELAARNAWLAERALAYELDQTIAVVRFDYFPARRQGILGADLLQADLEELEAVRLGGLKSLVPVKRTVSLARDFPLQFGQLKMTGQCRFHTSELNLQWSYPGVYGYRVAAVTATVATLEASPAVSGLLTHSGVSTLTRADGSSHVSVRPVEVLPLSDFRLRDDMALYGLPGETLLAFEGSGIDTFWTLELPAAANPYGLGGVADIILTFDLRASYSPDLKAVHVAAIPKTVSRTVLFSARKLAPSGLAALRDRATMGDISLTFDLRTIGLPKAEKGRRVNNIVVMLAGAGGITTSVQMSAPSLSAPVAVPIHEGVALSNAGAAAAPGVAPQPLNAFEGAPVDQAYTFQLNAGSIPADLRAHITDVVLGLDYTATSG